MHTGDNQSSGTIHDILSSVSEDCNQYESSVHTEDSSNERDLSEPKIEGWTHYDEEFNSILNQLNEDLRDNKVTFYEHNPLSIKSLENAKKV